MTRPPVIPPLRPEPDRDGYGRYLLAHPDTGRVRPWTRATTLAHTLDDTYNLSQWKRRMVLQGAAADPSLLTQVPALVDALTYADGPEARDIKAALDGVCDAAAHVAGADDGAGWGTALHAVTEYLDAGRIDDIEIPVDLLADVAIYAQTLTEAGIERPVEHIERIVVNTAVDTAGTYDRLLRLPDGRLVVGDLKTQQTIYDWLAIAVQLAQYAHADAIYNPDAGAMEPLPDDLDMSCGIVIHLPARSGTCRLYEVDLDAGWRAAQMSADVRAARGQARSYGKPWTSYHGRPGAADSIKGGSDALLVAITLAPNVDSLTTLWRNAADRWTDAHTDAAAHRKRQLAGKAAA